jgi:hypothetical protein
MSSRSRISPYEEVPLVSNGFFNKRKGKRVKVKATDTRRKDQCQGVIDFGFVKDCDRGRTVFYAEKMRADFSFIRTEVIGKMILEPLFGGGSKKQRKKKNSFRR